jgi:zinc protease
MKRRIHTRFLACFILALLLFSCAGGAKITSSGLGKASDPVPFMETARTGRLPSGIRYYLLENTQPEGRAYLTLAVNAGSILEKEDEQGLAHFVEHMAFNGTTRFAKSELINYLRSLGMRFGPEINAYTSFDETVYGIEVPVETGPDGRKKIPDMALAVIDDWSHGILFNPDDVDAERLVIIEEYRSRLGARERISREMYPLLFRDSPYAERLPIGRPEVIENAPAQRLEEFYKRWYRPENMAIIIVGDFDSAYLEASMTEHFPDHWTGSKEAFNRPRYNLSEPRKGSFETLIVTDDELTQSRIDLYWKQKSEPRRGDLAQYREGLIDYLASTMLSLRFEEERLKSETPYLAAGAGSVGYGYSSSFYMLVAIPKTGAVNESLRELFLVKESLSRYGFTQSETDNAKAFLLSNMEQMVAEKDRQPSNDFVRAFTRHFLKGETVPDLEWELDAIQRLLPGITLKEINKRVNDYFADDDLTVIISAPEAEKSRLPTSSDIRNLAAETRRANIARRVERNLQSELLERTPVPGQIISESTDSETGAIRMTLSNGLEVILKETRNRNSEVSLYALARGGNLSVREEFGTSAQLAAEMLNVSGLGPYSRTELMQFLLDKQASMSFWTDNYLRGFQGIAAVKDLQTLFEMIHLGFTQPRIDSDAVKALLDQRRTALAFQENDPNSFFFREITRSINGNPRFHPMTLPDLDRVNIDEALTFIRACLNPADYTFVFTGNIELPLLRSLSETYLASIPRASAFNEWANVVPQRPSHLEREVRKGREDRSAVYMTWLTSQSYSEEKSAAVSALSEYLQIILNDVVRESLGGVYSISTWVSLNPIPTGELSGVVYFVCDPRRAEELISAVNEEFFKIRQGSLDEAVFAKAIEALIQGLEESVQQNLFIAQSYANSAVIFNSPLARLDRRPALFRSLNISDLQKVMDELLGGNFARFILYPETH